MKILHLISSVILLVFLNSCSSNSENNKTDVTNLNTVSQQTHNDEELANDSLYHSFADRICININTQVQNFEDSARNSLLVYDIYRTSFAAENFKFSFLVKEKMRKNKSINIYDSKIEVGKRITKILIKECPSYLKALYFASDSIPRFKKDIELIGNKVDLMISKKAKKEFLTFQYVDKCIYYYLNKEYGNLNDKYWETEIPKKYDLINDYLIINSDTYIDQFINLSVMYHLDSFTDSSLII